MTDNPRKRRPTFGRLQFSLRTLLIAALILGPLSGWYGPWLVAKIHELVTKPEQPTPATAVPLPPRVVAFQQQRMQMQLRLMQQELELMLEQHEQRLLLLTADEPDPDVPKSLINRDGTFNMRYHHPPESGSIE